jgi:DNA-binding CsgD family transcriptional regulator
VGSSCHGNAQSLVGSDKALLSLPEGNGNTARLWGQGALTEEAVRAYGSYFCHLDLEGIARRKALGLEVLHTNMVYHPSEHDRLEIFLDWFVPYGLLDPISMAIDIGGRFPAGLSFFHDRRDASPFGERGLALLRLLLPAFKAGVHTSLRLAEYRVSLMQLIDDLSVGLGLFDTAGHLLHQNRNLSHLLSSDPEGTRLHLELERVGAAVAAGQGSKRMGSPEAPRSLLAREVRTTGGRYRLRGTYASAGFAGTGAAVVVLVEPLLPEPLSGWALRDGYGLTEREVEVARLLGEGNSNADIAERLAISLHTAERHTEHVLMKLGVRSRGKVAAKLRSE